MKKKTHTSAHPHSNGSPRAASLVYPPSAKILFHIIIIILLYKNWKEEEKTKKGGTLVLRLTFFLICQEKLTRVSGMKINKNKNKDK